MSWIYTTLKILAAKDRLRKVYAAWSEETKRKIIDEQEKTGLLSYVDHVVTDDFDISLWRSKVKIEGESIYSVALNAKEFDPFKAENVKIKIPADKFRGYKAILSSIADTISHWIDQYGKVAIGSSNFDKFKSYQNILEKEFSKRGIKRKPMIPENALLGDFYYR